MAKGSVSGPSILEGLPCRQPLAIRFLKLGQTEPIQVHDLEPSCCEVMDKLFLGVVAPVDLGNAPKLGA